jgi:dynein assembly factor 5
MLFPTTFPTRENQYMISDIVFLSQAFSFLSTEVIKLMSDPVERCRDLSLRVILAFLDVLDPPSIASCLSLLMPTLVYRIGSVPPVETSEEVRLLCMLVVSRLVSLFNRKMADYIDGLDGICHAGLCDSHPLVRLETANIVVLMCRALKAKMQV